MRAAGQFASVAHPLAVSLSRADAPRTASAHIGVPGQGRERKSGTGLDTYETNSVAIQNARARISPARV
ncbi:unnamed protein product, partial [Iphiclides podalirius]